MNTPKPQPPKSAKPQDSVKDDKKPYVLKPHLTSKPFRDNEGLRKLQSELNKKNRRSNQNPKAQRQR